MLSRFVRSIRCVLICSGLAVAGLSVSTRNSADVVVVSSDLVPSVVIGGPITATDIEVVERIDPRVVTIANSTGGDPYAAMQIGRIIRENRAFVVVPPNVYCFSSCALIYISGVTRTNMGHWQGNTHRINVEGRQLIELSRVGISGSEAVMCVSAEGGGMLYLFEKVDGEWMFIAEHQRWVV